jgi:hypothetical protein
VRHWLTNNRIYCRFHESTSAVQMYRCEPAGVIVALSRARTAAVAGAPLVAGIVNASARLIHDEQKQCTSCGAGAKILMCLNMSTVGSNTSGSGKHASGVARCCNQPQAFVQ